MKIQITAKRELCLTFAALSLAAPVNAQTNLLEPVIVTAQKREQPLQQAPIAVTALSAQDLDELQIFSIDGLASKSPNVIVVPTVGGSVNAGINIRGASSTVNNLSRDAAVGVYLDGVPIAKATGAIFDVADLERIEVLRGPQGTLYGKNTIGGAINLITASPSGEIGGKTTIGYGSENLRIQRTHFDTPALGESGEGAGKLAARLFYFRKLRDGFVENVDTSSKDFDNQDQWSARVALNWELHDQFSADYVYDRLELSQRPTALQIVELGSFRFIPVFGPIATDAFSTGRLDSISNDASLESTLGIRSNTLTLKYDLGATQWLGEVSINYILGRRDLDTTSLSDFDGTALDFARFGLFNKFKQNSHEVQWVGQSDAVNYVAGLFHYDEEWSTDNPRWNAQLLRGFDGVFEINQRDAIGDSSAAFGHLEWRVNPWLELSFGLRWTHERKNVNRLRVTDGLQRGSIAANNPSSGVFVRDAVGNAIFDAAGNFQALNANRDFSELTPLIAASFHVSQDLNIYLKYATGFKSGGYNDVASTNAEFLQGFDSETMRTLELGLKSLIFNDRLQLNAALFYNDYDEYQADVYVPEALGIGVQNAATATATGLELEMIALLGEGLELSLSYGHLEFEFDEYLTPDNFDTNGNGDRNEIIDVSNSRVVPYNMRNTAAAGLSYRRDVDLGTFFARLDYNFRDRHYFSGDPTTSLEQKAYGLWNARVGLGDIMLGDSKELSVDLWCKNLFDQEYLVSGLVFVGTYPTRGLAVGTYGEPRSFGVDISFGF